MNNQSERTYKVLARMVSKDGLPLSVFTTSTDLRDLVIAKGYTELPRSPTSIKTLVAEYSKTIRENQLIEIDDLKRSGYKFSLTFDDWTSNRNRRYLNLILHGQSSKIWNPGLVRMLGNMPAQKCLDLVETKLQRYKLSLSSDIVCTITDEASVMKKLGNLSPTFQQLCFAHGIQLAVLDVLYDKPQSAKAHPTVVTPTTQTVTVLFLNSLRINILLIDLHNT
jgi:hypothetical protein